MQFRKLAFTAAAAAMALAPAAHAADFTMKIAHAVPPGDPRDLGANRVAEILNASDSCDVDAQVYPSGQLGGTTDLIEGLQIGSIEAVVLPASFLVGFEPLVGIFDFPYFWPTEQAKLQAVMNGPAMDRLLATTEDQDVVSLDVWHTGYKEWTGNKPLTSPEDFAGLKSRVMPSPVLVEQQELLGLNPVNMPFSETYSALQNGTIDAQENPVVTTWVMKFHEVQSDVTMTNHGNLDQLFMVSKSWWDGLTDECRSAVEAAVDEGGALVSERTDALTEQALSDFEAQGVTITELTDEQFAALREATLPGVEAFYVEQNGDEGQAILDAFKQELSAE